MIDDSYSNYNQSLFDCSYYSYSGYMNNSYLDNFHYNKEERRFCDLSNRDNYHLNEIPTNFTTEKVKLINNKINNKSESNADIDRGIENYLGKKKGGSNGDSRGSHTKFWDDNARRKCKHIIIKLVKEFINKKIFNIFKGKIGNSVFIKQLLTTNQKQIVNTNTEFDRAFLHKTLKEIFSQDITTKYTLYPLPHNKNLINYLMSSRDEKMAQYFQSLFNLTFLDCLRHFRGSVEIEELKGLKLISCLEEKFGDDPEYLETLKYYLMNFEEILNNKRRRQKKINK